MSISHDFLVGFSKSFGLFYLLALSAAVVIYAYWPSNKKRFDQAAHSILADEDRPYEDKPYGDKQWR
jgi:cytochrome c oxidase cbb3-type subunit 4